MSAHSAAPWSIQQIFNNHWEVVNAARYWIGRFRGKESARLVAAAPELLEALKRIVEWNTRPLDSGLDAGRGITHMQLEQARAAIEKAEGAA